MVKIKRVLLGSVPVKLIAIIIALFFLNGCAVIRPVAQLTGGVIGTAGRLAGTAIKGAAAAAPFFL